MASTQECSKNKGLGIKGKERSRRSWTEREEEVLLVAVKELVAKGEKSDNGFRCGYLKKLELAMKLEFPDRDIKGEPHIRSRLSTWKKNYGSLTTMLSRSGVGFKPDFSIECSEQQWEEISRVDGNVRNLQSKTWPFFNAWKEFFGKDKATGERAEDVTEALNHDENVTAAGMEEATHHNLDDILNTNAVEDNVCQSSQGDTGTRTTNKKRKKSDPMKQLCDLLVELHRDTNARLEDLATGVRYQADLGKAMTEIYDLIKVIPGLSLQDKFANADILCDKVERLEMFMGLDESERPEYVIHLLKDRP